MKKQKILNDVDEEELKDETLFEEPENANKKQLSSFKIFTDEKSDFLQKKRWIKIWITLKLRETKLKFFSKVI